MEVHKVLTKLLSDFEIHPHWKAEVPFHLVSHILFGVTFCNLYSLIVRIYVFSFVICPAFVCCINATEKQPSGIHHSCALEQTWNLYTYLICICVCILVLCVYLYFCGHLYLHLSLCWLWINAMEKEKQSSYIQGLPFIVHLTKSVSVFHLYLYLCVYLYLCLCVGFV